MPKLVAAEAIWGLAHTPGHWKASGSMLPHLRKAMRVASTAVVIQLAIVGALALLVHLGIAGEVAVGLRDFVLALYAPGAEAAKWVVPDILWFRSYIPSSATTVAYSVAIYSVVVGLFALLFIVSRRRRG